MGRIAAVAVAAIIGFRGLSTPEAVRDLLGPLADYSLPVVLGLLALGMTGALGLLGSAGDAAGAGRRAGDARIPLHVPLLALLFLSFVLSYLVSTGITGDRSPRAGAVFTELAVGLVFTHLVYLSFRTRADLELLRRGLVVAGTGVAIYLLYRSLVAPDPTVRLGTFQTANYADLSYAVAVAAWMGPVTAYLSGRGWRWSVGSPHLAVMLGASLLTGTRAGIWAMMLLVPLFILVRQRREHARGWPWFLLGAITTLWAMIGLLSSRAVVSRGLDILAFTRGDIWMHAIEGATSSVRAFFVGVGIGAYDLDGVLYPHNLVLDAQYSAGIVATGILVSLIAILGLSTYRLARETDPGHPTPLADTALAIVGLGLVALVGGLVTYSLPSNLFLWLFIGAASRLQQLSRTTGRPLPAHRARPTHAPALPRRHQPRHLPVIEPPPATPRGDRFGR